MNYFKYLNLTRPHSEVEESSIAVEIVKFDCYEKRNIKLEKEYISKIKFYCDENCIVKYFLFNGIPFAVNNNELIFDYALKSSLFFDTVISVELSNYHIKDKTITLIFY